MITSAWKGGWCWTRQGDSSEKGFPHAVKLPGAGERVRGETLLAGKI